jgi:hypothetical protein
MLQVVKNLGEHGIVTCGADQMIIIWKVRAIIIICRGGT